MKGLPGLRRRVPAVAWTLLGASAITTLGTLPVFLLSSQSVYIRDDLGFDELRFGVAVSVFFGRCGPRHCSAGASPTAWVGVPARSWQA